MSITPYLVGGSALVVGLAVGYVKFMERGTEAREARAETATVQAECAVSATESVNTAAMGQIASLTAELERQKAIAAAAKKKADDRLRENNLLRRNIQNVTENPPVPDAIERVLDGMRGAVPGPGQAPGGADESGTSGASDTSGPSLPTEAAPSS